MYLRLIKMFSYCLWQGSAIKTVSYSFCNLRTNLLCRCWPKFPLFFVCVFFFRLALAVQILLHNPRIAFSCFPVLFPHFDKLCLSRYWRKVLVVIVSSTDCPTAFVPNRLSLRNNVQSVSLSLYLSLCFCLPVSVSVCQSVCLSVCLSLSLTHTHTHTHARTHARTRTRTHTHARTHARTRTHAHTHTHTQSPKRSLPPFFPLVVPRTIKTTRKIHVLFCFPQDPTVSGSSQHCV